MAQTAVKTFFNSSHSTLQQHMNQWLTEVSGQVAITGISMDSNEYGHCLVIMYQTEGQGRFYRGHLFFHNSHSTLEANANQGLLAAQAAWGKFVAVGSNQYGHCLCVIEEQ